MRLIDPPAPLLVDAGASLVERELLEPPLRNDLRCLARDVAALLLDRELCKLSRARSLIDLKLCGLLAALDRSAGYRRLGFVRLGDYGRERLGLGDRYCRELSALGARLAELPRLAAAMERGEVSVSKARVLTRVAEPASEAGWLDLARRHTVRRLKDLVAKRVAEAAAPDAAPDASADADAIANAGALADADTVAAGRRGAGPDISTSYPVSFSAPAPFLGKWHAVLDLARRVAGSPATDGQALEWVLMEFLSHGLAGLAAGAEAAADAEADPALRAELEALAAAQRLG